MKFGSGLWPAVVVSTLLLFASPLRAEGAGEYLSLADFLDKVFGAEEADQPRARVYWLTPELKQQLRNMTGRDYPRLRVRYWQRGARTAWVLEEIGKEMPITIGVAVEAQRIVQLEILTFRESRGWEVRHPFFTRQFDGLGLNEERDLSGRVDSITGATLSVHAVKKVARLALIFDAEVNPGGEHLAAGSSIK